MRTKKPKEIRITYNSKPFTPNNICHTFPLKELTEVRTRRFKIEDKDLAWIFLTECTSPITKLKQIMFAFDYKPSIKILDAIEDNIIDKFGNIINKEIEQDKNTVSLNYAKEFTTDYIPA